MSAILTSIQSLLSDPNPNSPANSMAAQLFKENRREYEKRVKACVEQSWCDDWFIIISFESLNPLATVLRKSLFLKKNNSSQISFFSKDMNYRTTFNQFIFKMCK